MMISNVKDYTKNSKTWLIGDFFPSVYKTKDFEFGIHYHKAGEEGQTHYHRFSKEINVIMEGQVIINGKTFLNGDIFIIDEYVVSESYFIEDTTLLVIRNKSLPGDKVVVK